MKDKNFYNITNSMIYAELKAVRSDLEALRDTNDNAHNNILIKHQKNRAEIDMVKYISAGALGIGLFLSANLIIKII